MKKLFCILLLTTLAVFTSGCSTPSEDGDALAGKHLSGCRGEPSPAQCAKMVKELNAALDAYLKFDDQLAFSKAYYGRLERENPALRDMILESRKTPGKKQR
ncbi:MAG: hypothetical protein ACYS8W_14210 [Planctomycetota bacterium]|jgi:hypothetical protein